MVIFHSYVSLPEGNCCFIECEFLNTDGQPLHKLLDDPWDLDDHDLPVGNLPPKGQPPSNIYCLVVSNMNGLFSISYMGQSVPLMNSYFSRWLLHHQLVYIYNYIYNYIYIYTVRNSSQIHPWDPAFFREIIVADIIPHSGRPHFSQTKTPGMMVGTS